MTQNTLVFGSRCLGTSNKQCPASVSFTHTLIQPWVGTYMYMYMCKTNHTVLQVTTCTCIWVYYTCTCMLYKIIRCHDMYSIANMLHTLTAANLLNAMVYQTHLIQVTIVSRYSFSTRCMQLLTLPTTRQNRPVGEDLGSAEERGRLRGTCSDIRCLPHQTEQSLVPCGNAQCRVCPTQ